ncbi:DUF4349 domain-containing protein [Chryseobacterium gossypii]|uniref:DUF4349 domain-containing protein n=1 Tax=Chryseobacterium gossypii TaxID=3231602 RepID=UPI003524BC3B
MKKFILLIAVSGSFIMCKKGEVSQSGLANSADSAVSDVVENMNDIRNTASTVLDSAHVRIKDFDSTTTGIRKKLEATSKSIDSLSDKIAVTKLESKTGKKDSAHENRKTAVNIPATRVIKETKVIYKEKSGNESDEPAPKDKMIKTGTLELTVNDAETAKETVKEEVLKYDGFIRSENISLNNNDRKIAYLKIKVPIQKFEYLMDEISYNIGKVENKGIEVSGQSLVQNTMCEVDITLYETDEAYAKSDEPKTFSDKSWAAISSGWNVITSIFLFLLPFWPLFLLAGAGYYFYKRKARSANGHSNQ